MTRYEERIKYTEEDVDKQRLTFFVLGVATAFSLLSLYLVIVGG